MKSKIEAHSKRLPRKLLLAMAFITAAGVGANASAGAGMVVVDPVNFVPNAATAIKMHYVIDELKKISGEEGNTLYDIQNEYNTYMQDITNINNTYVGNMDRPPVIDPIEDEFPVIDGALVDGDDESAEEMSEYMLAVKSTLGQQEAANDILLLQMKNQGGTLKEDTDRVSSLRSAATTAEGHATQMQYANALAAEQSNQVMQLRKLTLAAQNAEAARARAVVAREKRELQAASNLIK